MVKLENVGINGYGRMGKLATRLIKEDRGWDIGLINASRSELQLIYGYKYDTVHGKTTSEVSYGDNCIIIDGNVIPISSERNPEKIPWKEHGVKWVIDTTGKNATFEDASRHLTAGAEKVIISYPSKEGNPPMFVNGVNSDDYIPGTKILSGASCTTNCLAPLAKVLNDNFGLEGGLLNTVHAVTNKQHPVDGFDPKDPRIGRASYNIIPTSTGAANAVGFILPELSGKLTGMATRVGTLDVSMIDLTVILKKSTTYEDVCKVIKEASEGSMKDIIGYTDEPLVSSDFIGDKRPCIFDATAGIALDGHFMKLIAWYDNEIGYLNQLLKTLEYAISVDNAK